MDEIIKTQSIGKDFVKTNGVLLEQTPDTALMFFPQIHPGGVRGHLIRFKKNRNEKWEEIKECDFRKLQLYEGAHIELGTDQLTKLIAEVAKRKIISEDGVQYGNEEYVVARKNTVLQVDDQNIKEILEQLLANGYSDEFWGLISSSHPELADKLIAGHLQLQRKKTIVTLKQRLNQSLPETKGGDSWQRWIYANNWLFGVNYTKPIEKQKININGIMPDYLFPTLDGFIDVLEIKLPTFEVIEMDVGHNGSWVWSREANYAIGQVVNYLCEIDRQKLEIENQIKKTYGKEISMLKPRAFILIGQSDDWSKDQKEGLRKLNHSLHGIEVITYSDLVGRGESFVDIPGNNLI